MEVCRKTLKKVSPDLQVFLVDLSQRGLSTGKGYAAEFIVTGPDWDKLAGYSTEIMKSDEGQFHAGGREQQLPVRRARNPGHSRPGQGRRPGGGYCGFGDCAGHPHRRLHFPNGLLPRERA